MSFDRISDRIVELSQGLQIDAPRITQKAISGIISGMKTSEIDTHVAETAFALSTYNPDYDTLSARLSVSNLHKQTSPSLIKTLQRAMDNTSKGRSAPLVDSTMFEFAKRHADVLERALDYTRDYGYSYMAIRTLSYGYLLRESDSRVIIERPQQMLMRVGLGLWYPRKSETEGKTEAELAAIDSKALTNALATYGEMGSMKFTHATPTLFNSGTPFPQYGSCNLLSIDDDMGHIYETLKRSALISKFAGGLGVNCSLIRCRGSIIRSTNGPSSGIVPLAKQFDYMVRYADQGGKRNGVAALFIEPWHGDIYEFLDLRLNDAASDDVRARKLFIGLWVPDLFMKRAAADEMWSLMCPDAVRGLVDSYGDEFERIYCEAEASGKFLRQVRAQDLLRRICETQANCGLPYVMYKDAVNRKSNQSNIGVIRGSNLCTEIVQFSDKDNVAVCNLASISIPAFVKTDSTGTPSFDYAELDGITRLITANLNRTIDYGYIAVAEASRTNKLQRAIGIGVQGFHEAMIAMRIEWDSEQAKDFHARVAETIYYAALDKSAELGAEEGSYPFFAGSPISQGILQCDMWGVNPRTNYDWDGLRAKCKIAMRNSMLTAYMPTATTSQIMGNTEAFECASSNISARKVLAGEFPVVSRQLCNDLSKLGLWTPAMVDAIIADGGSVQDIPQIPANIKRLYRTVWEISQKVFIDLMIARAPFVDQACSFNVHLKTPTVAALSSLHMYTWQQGSKNSSYYVRSKPARDAVKFTLTNNQTVTKAEEPAPVPTDEKKAIVCTELVCTSCSA